MNIIEEPSVRNHYHADYVHLITSSLKRLTGIEVVDFSQDVGAQARQAFHADYVLLAHDAKPDPCFCYANTAGLRLFEMSWEEFTHLKSKFSAESDERTVREKMLAGVAEKGYINDYSGIRISKSGRRFKIKDVFVWNVSDLQGNRIGQAAMFQGFEYI